MSFLQRLNEASLKGQERQRERVGRVLAQFQEECLEKAALGLTSCNYSKNPGFFAKNHGGFPTSCIRDEGFISGFMKSLAEQAHAVMGDGVEVGANFYRGGHWWTYQWRPDGSTDCGCCYVVELQNLQLSMRFPKPLARCSAHGNPRSGAICGIALAPSRPAGRAWCSSAPCVGRGNPLSRSPLVGTWSAQAATAISSRAVSARSAGSP
eukprot:CAMPEP_0179209592 /NCGR_PEP_ID=MMETSP0796-20121207/104531_1 /TAXON_ID=73915 /ORGANISM="Pyrodinium bahamense, Strain pbaha01" /LENGTH=208 /DNA_ID=CAMNT_0020914551 /DNA_START=12 /DNA_END=638 /DNA_ORIENTATION=+